MRNLFLRCQKTIEMFMQLQLLCISIDLNSKVNLKKYKINWPSDLHVQTRRGVEVIGPTEFPSK